MQAMASTAARRVEKLRVTADKEANVSHARETIAKGASHGAQMVVLPEMWNCPYTNASFPVYAEDIEAGASPSTQMLSAAAAEHVATTGRKRTTKLTERRCAWRCVSCA
mmetsp:Transcript_3197/g.19776  ORF Transcript_3197/g.19776 Transcript_3197/m.19776 type:complete len:109 (+) Transcript_3197:191-517(+)